MKTRLVSIGYRKSLLQQLNCLVYFSIPNLLLHLDILKSAHVFLRDENTKSFLDSIQDTHSMKETLTVSTGEVPFHLSLDNGGVRE
jgi:hypothetical protein